MSDVLTRLSQEIEARKGTDAKASYTASLLERGEDTILQKVGEESVEFILAAKGGDTAHVVSEAADVWFHMLVMLSAKGLSASDILDELERREGVSGHAAIWAPRLKVSNKRSRKMKVLRVSSKMALSKPPRRSSIRLKKSLPDCSDDLFVHRQELTPVKTDLASELESGDLKKLIGDQREQINELRDMVSTAKKDFQSTTQSVIKNTKEGLEELETSVNDARRDVAEVAETQAPKSTPSAIETQTSAASDSAASQSSADNDTTPAKTSDKSSDNRGDKTGKDTASPTTKRSGTTDSGTP